MARLPSSLTTVTTFSKILAVILFFTFIIAAFLVGMKYQAMVGVKPFPVPVEKFCGGFAGIACPTGYECQLDGKYPDAAGKCIKQ